MSVAEATAPIREESTSRFVQTKRWKLHYNEAGQGHPVIFLHGTGPGASGWSNFSQNVAPLAKTHRVITLDSPGWGKSDVFDCTGESRNGANAQAVALLMDELGIDKAAIVGNSMGGAATLQFMADYPDRITHAVTMGSGVFAMPNIFSPGGGPPQGFKVIVETYRDPSPENFRRLVEVMVYDSSFVTDELTKERSVNALAVKDHLANWLKWPMGNPKGPYGDLEHLLGKLASTTVPTLMIHGRDDRTVPMETSLRTSAIIPNSRLVIFNRCGHWAQLEHAAEFDRLLLGFLNQYPVA
ncbi:alpha/beta fold hydrolase [Phenylobacterium sp.]|uniref:alpha/beta fold hydrolase n=1 Tax=Phenylobacterium sp. TaxID=1871053 RepID=UPI0035ADF7DA